MKAVDFENLVVVKEEGAIQRNFPIPIDPIGVPRTPENEAKYRHVTSLIVPILKLEQNKILTTNKYKKNQLKNPKKKFPPLCIDTVGGGHFCIDLIPEEERKKGILTLETAREQAYRELCEELKPKPSFSNIPSFVPQDLVFLGFYPYENECNKELSIAFGLVISHLSDSYESYDDYIKDGVKRELSLPLMPYSYLQLMEMMHAASANSDKYQIEDGLGRLLDRGDLDKVIQEVEMQMCK